jgi:PmbA protein
MSAAPHPSIDAAIDAALDELRRAGCAGAVRAHRSSNWSARVRKGAIEKIESSQSSGLRVTAYGAGNRHAGCATTETTESAARELARRAAELCAFGDADEWAGLPPAAECGLVGGDLRLEDAGYGEADHERLARAAIEAETAAFAVDPRITNSHRSGASAHRGESWMATTDGVRVRRRGTSFGYHAVVVAQDQAGERQTGSFWTGGRHRDRLKSSVEVGREAGARAVRGYGWKQVPSGPTRVLLDRDVASELLGILAGAVAGGAVYRGSTFLAGKLGQAIAAPGVTIVDDPLIPGEYGSRACDGEGVRSRRLAVIEQGRLASWLVDGYAARRLKHPYTGHDGGCSNLRLLPGEASFADLTRELGDGLIVYDTHGHGVNLANGTISKGVSALRVEGGKVTHPVQEVTIAAKLADVLMGIRAIGDDPLDQHAVSSPSLLIDGFTVGGA